MKALMNGIMLQYGKGKKWWVEFWQCLESDQEARDVVNDGGFDDDDARRQLYSSLPIGTPALAPTKTIKS